VRKLVKKIRHDKPIPLPHSLAGSHLPFLYQSFLNDRAPSLIAHNIFRSASDPGTKSPFGAFLGERRDTKASDSPFCRNPIALG